MVLLIDNLWQVSHDNLSWYCSKVAGKLRRALLRAERECLIGGST